MVDWIIILGIHICREGGSFQRPVDVWSSEFCKRFTNVTDMERLIVPLWSQSSGELYVTLKGLFRGANSLGIVVEV
jgi:hypothetical protein